MRIGEVFEFPVQRTGVGFEGLEIEVGVIGLALLPASKVNAHELVGQGAAGLMMLAFIALFLLLVIEFGPRFFLQSAAGVFVKGLPTKLRAAIADMNSLGVATLNHYGCHAIEFSHILGFVEPIPVGAEGHQQTWGQSWPSARKAPKDGRIGMLIHV